jgi:glycine/D-amino acid oxidase-like deaminating enzyme
MTLSYWHLKGRFHGKFESKNLLPPESCDIAIIGAGITGIALAYYLRLLGCDKVIVLEKEFIGYGASGRNAGFLLSGMAEPYNRLVVGMGHEGAKSITRATLDNHQLIADAIKSGCISCDYIKSGSFHLATSEFEANELQESADLLQKDDFGGEYYGSREIDETLIFGNFSGGYFNPNDGCLDPYAFVTGLSRGIDVYQGFEVNSIEKAAGLVILKGNGKIIKAEMAILATNAYSPLLDDYFKQMIFPVRGQMLASTLNEPNPLKNMTYYANFGYDYFRQSPEGAILMGGLRNRFIDTEIGYDDFPNPELQQGLEDYIRYKIGARRLEIACRWTGVMGNTIDGLPLVGALPHNSAVLCAVGYNGHGFGLGMVVARDIARALMQNETSDLLNRFSIKRFAR